MPEAKDVLEDAIIRHNSGFPLDVNTRKSFHLILWEQAAAAMDVGCGRGYVGEGRIGWGRGGECTHPLVVHSRQAPVSGFRTRGSCHVLESKAHTLTESVPQNRKLSEAVLLSPCASNLHTRSSTTLCCQ